MARCDMYVQLDLGDDATGAWVKEHNGYNLAGHDIYQNTGFVYFRSAPAMIRLLGTYLGYMDEQTGAGRNTDDQTHWNQYVQCGASDASCPPVARFLRSCCVPHPGCSQAASSWPVSARAGESGITS